MNLKDVITTEVIGASAGGSYDDLESEPVRPGFALQITHIAVENKTTAFTRLVVGVADGTTFLEKEEEDSPQENNIYWTISPLWIPAGKKLRARLTGCTSGDYIKLTYEGMLYEV